MTLTGVHLLLTYECNFECDHCFVWGGPHRSGTMPLRDVRTILAQARALGTVEWIYFEGGEPFLYHAALLCGVREAAAAGFRVGIVSNAFWATGAEDALECLRPFAGLVGDLSISRDAHHGNDEAAGNADRALAAAARLGIPADAIRIGPPEASGACPGRGQLAPGESGIMFRGRAAAKLAPRAGRRPWEEFTECPHEDLREPGRVHVDAFGHVHVCQGISIGNVFRNPLREICGGYDPDAHAVVGALLRGGPAGLFRELRVPHEAAYADACHACDAARHALRGRYPVELAPGAMYGES